MALFRSIATVGGYTLISRVLGFVRDILLAAILGASVVADAFFVAFKLPNFFRRLFAEGAFNVISLVHVGQLAKMTIIIPIIHYHESSDNSTLSEGDNSSSMPKRIR